MVSQGCWFLFQHLFYEFPTFNSFLGKSGPKKSKLFILSKSWHTWSLEDADSYFNICFLNFKLKIHFLAKFGSRKSNLSILPENWHTWDLEDVNSYSKISFLNFKT